MKPDLSTISFIQCIHTIVTVIITPSSGAVARGDVDVVDLASLPCQEGSVNLGQLPSWNVVAVILGFSQECCTNRIPSLHYVSPIQMDLVRIS